MILSRFNILRRLSVYSNICVTDRNSAIQSFNSPRLRLYLGDRRKMATGGENRLSLEKSPYLLQHATNPVDWYPWGEEAFKKAREEDKLIFLSVGYSTCHWCHVMERESFEDEETAAIMNKHFVNVKVDREERPDVDKLYMTFIQVTVGGGGWPMSVFLTPTLKPFTGGTYFPPVDTPMRPSFKTVLKDVAGQWEQQRADVVESSARVFKILQKNITESKWTEATSVPDESRVQKCVRQLAKFYDAAYGGFSTAPKFPQPSNFNFLFHVYSRDKESDEGSHALEMCLHSLRRIAYGGIHDHVNGGFARYSVDGKWHVPHFEKMLYDNAQLAVSFCDAYVVTKDTFFAEIVHDILGYVTKNLSHKSGGFYGAQDADSYPEHGAPEKKEGAFCVWEYSELETLLDFKEDDLSALEVFVDHYSVTKNGNVPKRYDPHGELFNKNVLCCLGTREETAAKHNIAVDALIKILGRCHEILRQARQSRPKPITDTKMVTAWQGLAIAGYAKAGFALKEQKYIDRAILAANFIKNILYDVKSKTLLRCCYLNDDGEIAQTHHTPIEGFLSDYAFVIRGLLDLYEASLDSDWLQWAEILQETQDRLFWDESGDGYFTSRAGDVNITIRGKEDQDGAEPCGNSVSVSNLLRLYAYLDRDDFKLKAGRTLTAFSVLLTSVPIALPEMMSALLLYHNSPTQVFIAGEAQADATQALLDVVRSRLIPGRVLAVADGGGTGLLYRRHESLSRLRPVAGKSAAYVCRNFACSLPVTEPSDLADSLDFGLTRASSTSSDK